MKLYIKAEQIVVKPAKYSVKFYESCEYGDYVGGDSYKTMNDFRPDIATWLENNAPGWTATFDRGDWGEGPVLVRINFTEETHAREFYALFNVIPCLNALSRQHCANIQSAVLKARKTKDGKSQCADCGYVVSIYKQSSSND